MFNKARFDALPPAYQAILKVASQAVNLDMLAHYDTVNTSAIRSLVGAGAKLRPFSPEIMKAAYDATNQTYDEISATNPTFKAMLESMKAFRKDYYAWAQVADYPFETFMVQQQRAGTL